MKSIIYKAFGCFIFCSINTDGFSQWVDPGGDNTGDIYYNNGKVGIGTSSPGAKLEISNDQYKQLLLSNNGSEKLYLGSVWSSVGSFVSNNSYYNASSQYTALDNVANGIQFRESGDIHLFANTGLTVSSDFLPTPRLSVKYDGNIGIGTTNPATKLEVSNNEYKQLLLSNHGSEKLYLGSVWSSVGSFISNNSYYNTSLQYTALDNVANGIQFRESGDIHLFANTGLTVNNDFLPTPRLSVKSNGNIGIGTNTPGAKLSIKDSNSTLDFYGDSSGNSYLRVNSGELRIRPNGSTVNKFILSSDRAYFANNVGIGTTTPSNKLDVAGTIRAEEVKVETGWADYVFHEDYELKSLSEVSTYIQENHHLPGIPTAEEVAENGIKLGEMNAKLLEKVEELTLYLIEKDKEIINQSQVIEQLIGRIEKLENK